MPLSLQNKVTPNSPKNGLPLIKPLNILNIFYPSRTRTKNYIVSNTNVKTETSARKREKQILYFTLKLMLWVTHHTSNLEVHSHGKR